MIKLQIIRSKSWYILWQGAESLGAELWLVMPISRIESDLRMRFFCWADEMKLKPQKNMNNNLVDHLINIFNDTLFDHLWHINVDIDLPEIRLKIEDNDYLFEVSS